MLDKNADGYSQEDLLKQERIKKVARRKKKIEEVDANVPPDIKPFVTQARDKGASSWLNALPIEELDFQLNKEEFRDALRLRYNLKLENLPSMCPCGSSFTVSHALSCKKGGYIHERHDSVKDTLISAEYAMMLSLNLI